MRLPVFRSLPTGNKTMDGALQNGAICEGGRAMVRCDGERHPEIEAEAAKTILLVEDEVLVRMTIADQLRDAGYVVIEASNADEAMQVLRHKSADVRLIFSDVRMPGTMDGVGFAREVRSQYPLIKIVLTSAHTPKLEAEYDGFFPKPYVPTTIIRHIKSLLD
jgi:CheY-like chemotaxis protein